MSETPAKPSKTTVFLRRSFSSVLLWVVVLGSVLSGNKLISDGVFFLMILAIAGLGLSEFYALCGSRVSASFARWGVWGGVLLAVTTNVGLSGLGGARWQAHVGEMEGLVLTLLLIGLCLWRFLSIPARDGMTAIGVTLFGVLYVPWLLNYIQKIYFFPDVQGSYYLLLFVFATKFSDLGAYVTGSLFGRHKMIPRISPGKTWEGFAGALVISTLVSVGFAWLARGRLPDLTLGHAAVIGLVLGSTAVIGDLVESVLKREAGVKDSGRLFPGIGGVLDLMDSLLFNAPLMYLYLRYVVIG
jgi:phosphatidate cytidylyltransferase